MVQMTAQSWVKSLKIDKIDGVMSWTSGSKQSSNLPCHGKYLSKSSETLETESTRHYAKDL